MSERPNLDTLVRSFLEEQPDPRPELVLAVPASRYLEHGALLLCRAQVIFVRRSALGHLEHKAWELAKLETATVESGYRGTTLVLGGGYTLRERFDIEEQEGARFSAAFRERVGAPAEPAPRREPLPTPLPPSPDPSQHPPEERHAGSEDDEDEDEDLLAFEADDEDEDDEDEDFGGLGVLDDMLDDEATETRLANWEEVDARLRAINGELAASFAPATTLGCVTAAALIVIALALGIAVYGSVDATVGLTVLAGIAGAIIFGKGIDVGDKSYYESTSKPALERLMAEQNLRWADVMTRLAGLYDSKPSLLGQIERERGIKS